MGPATGHELGADLSLSFWIRSVDTRQERVILAFATADAAKEVCVVHPGGLQVQVAGNVVNTGVAVNDGHWHHVVIVWTGRELRGKDDKTRKGEILVYSNAVLMYRGPGITAGGLCVCVCVCVCVCTCVCVHTCVCVVCCCLCLYARVSLYTHVINGRVLRLLIHGGRVSQDVDKCRDLYARGPRGLRGLLGERVGV